MSAARAAETCEVAEFRRAIASEAAIGVIYPLGAVLAREVVSWVRGEEKGDLLEWGECGSGEGVVGE